ncbi:MAG: CoA ester lyase [Pseudomonadales bacterium]|nr:CoA ester lyase [Pseudomonadales bacterium]
MRFKPRRSALYIPGSNKRALEKAVSLAADVVILDLEDAVSPDNKIQARAQLLDTLGRQDFGEREVVVRINGLDTDWGVADLAAFHDAGIDALLLPKVERPDQIEHAESLMSDHHYDSSIGLWAMIETPLAIIQVNDICQASDRLNALVMGTSDLAKELRVPHTRDRTAFLYALSRCVLAARAFGLDIIDGVCLDLDDESGYAQGCCQGRELGFDGKSLIHPKQIALANHYFSPSEESVAFAKKIICAWESSENKGVLVVDGKLVEYLHVLEAKRTLEISRLIAGRSSAQ